MVEKSFRISLLEEQFKICSEINRNKIEIKNIFQTRAQLINCFQFSKISLYFYNKIAFLQNYIFLQLIKKNVVPSAKSCSVVPQNVVPLFLYFMFYYIPPGGCLLPFRVYMRHEITFCH